MTPTKVAIQLDIVPYKDSALDPEQRAKDLVSRMTVEEKIAQTMMDAPAIPRLEVPAYHYCNEALHGVAANGAATVFPQAIALAATWDPELIFKVADVISTEARAKYREALENGGSGKFQGLTLWAPNINIFRDPRWGRGQETYGEDPYLTTRMGVAFVKGIQGNDRKYLKAVATPKHFAVHSGPEQLRHGFDAWVTEQDLYDTYLPAFEACVKEGDAKSVMSAYSGFNGIPCTGNSWLLTELLREQWGFDGAVVSDIDSVGDIFSGHQITKSLVEAAALALRAGNDECSGVSYKALGQALEQGLIHESNLDTALIRLFTLRFKLGMFDSPEECLYQNIDSLEYDTPAHENLALEVAEKSLVLLKNDGLLPITKEKVKRAAVIGPLGRNLYALTGNYNGNPARPITIFEGISKRFNDAGIAVEYLPGCPVVYGVTEPSPLPNGCVFEIGHAEMTDADRGMSAIHPDEDKVDFEGVRNLVAESDVVILSLGITPELEGEEMAIGYDGFEGGDRTSLELPKPQRELWEFVSTLGKPFVVVLAGGSALSIDPSKPGAILLQWYSGQQGGIAVARALLGEINPAGRLPITFYRSLDDLPPFSDYGMQGRSYRYYKGEPLFPFGHGLSFTQFAYGNPSVRSFCISTRGSIGFTLPLANIGVLDGEEVVQVYARRTGQSPNEPIRRLIGLRRVPVRPRESLTVDFDIPVFALRSWDEKAKRYTVPPGIYVIEIGASSQDIRRTLRIEVST